MQHPHRSLSLALLAIAALVRCAALPALAQDAIPAANAGADDRRISIDVMVTDKAGTPIQGLQQADFTLLDNKQPQNLIAFQAFGPAQTNPQPTHVVIVIDSVNSPFTTIAREREQIGEYLKQDDGRLAVPTTLAVMTDGGLQLDKGATEDGKALDAVLQKSANDLRTVGRSQGFYGAADRLQRSLSQLSQLTAYEATQPGRKLVLMVSPGWPMLISTQAQTTTKEQAWMFNAIVDFTNALRKADVVLYALDPNQPGRSNPFYYESYLKGVASARKAEYANLALQVFAVHSGGTAQVTGMDVVGELKNDMRDAGTYYRLTFAAQPGDQPDEYHALEVKVTAPNAKVRTSAGYYANTRQLNPTGAH
jgi:VWFA-related protein